MFSRVWLWAISLQQEDGVETIEWIGLAAVVLVLLGAIALVFGKDTAVGSAIIGAFTRLIGRIG